MSARKAKAQRKYEVVVNSVGRTDLVYLCQNIDAARDRALIERENDPAANIIIRPA